MVYSCGGRCVGNKVLFDRKAVKKILSFGIDSCGNIGLGLLNRSGNFGFKSKFQID